MHCCIASAQLSKTYVYNTVHCTLYRWTTDIGIISQQQNSNKGRVYFSLCHRYIPIYYIAMQPTKSEELEDIKQHMKDRFTLHYGNIACWCTQFANFIASDSAPGINFISKSFCGEVFCPFSLPGSFLVLLCFAFICCHDDAAKKMERGQR